ncbi:PiggyBac transposable element-derived 4 [Homalodisca vitripennis]|nr:PiggyBac transposable element-derived 4 [Homalodisca vitripennis]
MKRQKLKKGELTFSSTQNMLCFKRKDRKDVTVLSTIHERPDLVDVVSQRERSRPNPKSTLKPNVVVDYNQSMCGVDKQDQRLSSFPVMRKPPTAGRPPTCGESPLRLQGNFWGHFIKKIPPTTKARPSRKSKSDIDRDWGVTFMFLVSRLDVTEGFLALTSSEIIGHIIRSNCCFSLVILFVHLTVVQESHEQSVAKVLYNILYDLRNRQLKE